MQWLDQLPFADNRVVQIGFLAACGIAALIVLAIVYRLAFAHRLRVPGGRTRQPRLGLVDAFSLDGQRQLVLVRRDNVEHLVMIGGPNDVLVELQINRAMPSARENAQASPLLAPGTPARRTETAVAAAPVVAEAPPAKVTAPRRRTPAPAAPKAATRRARGPQAPTSPAARSRQIAGPRRPGDRTRCTATAPAPRCQTDRTGAGGPPGASSAAFAGRAIGGAGAGRAAGAREFDVASLADPTSDAPADRPRGRLRQSGHRHPPRRKRFPRELRRFQATSPTPSEPAAPSRSEKAGSVAAARA